MSQAYVDTYTLTLDGAAAELRVTIERVKNGFRTGTDRVRKSSRSETFEGHVDRVENGIVLSFPESELYRHIRCRRRSVEVAAATAIRTDDPQDAKSAEEECGGGGVWAPSTLHAADVLECNLASDGYPRDDPLWFGARPGVEYLYVNNDCAFQGGDYRRIPDDGSVAVPMAKPGGRAN